jgi:hypothetical protein
MKFPKGFQKWTNEDQRKWVRKRLEEVRQQEKELLAINRKLVADNSFTVLVDNDDRPDLIQLKS